MKGGFNKVFRNFAAMKGKTEFDKVSLFVCAIIILMPGTNYGCIENDQRIIWPWYKRTKRETCQMYAFKFWIFAHSFYRPYGLTERCAFRSVSKSSTNETIAKVYRKHWKLGCQLQNFHHLTSMYARSRSGTGSSTRIVRKVRYFDSLQKETLW